MKNAPLVVLVEPSYYGIGYVDAVVNRGYNMISVVSSPENPAKYGYVGKYHDLIVADIRDAESILHAIQHSPYAGNIDALIPATDYATHITARVAESLNLRHVSYDAAMRARNKDMARACYDKYKVPSAAYRVITNLQEARAAIAQIGYPAVIKPTNCASSQNVLMINNDDQLQKAVEILQNFHETYMGFKPRSEFLIEEYIDGPEFSVEIFTVGGKIGFASVTEKMTTEPPYFAELAHTVPTPSHLDKTNSLIDVAAKAVFALGFDNGPCHVELRLSRRGPVIVETNGRPGGDEITRQLLVNAFGVNFFEATVDFYLDRDIDLTPKKKVASTIAYFTAAQEGKLHSLAGVENLGKKRGVVTYKIDAKPGDQLRPARNSDDRLGYVITVAETPVEAKRIALEAVNSVLFNYE